MGDAWTHWGGAFNATRHRMTDVEARVRAALELPEVLYDEAPQAYLRRTLTDVLSAQALLQDLQRLLVDEAIASQAISRRSLAHMLDVSPSTVQRWRDEPLQYSWDELYERIHGVINEDRPPLPPHPQAFDPLDAHLDEHA